MLTTGLIHIYTGDGKGKTTASVGLAVRAKSRGLKVLYAQFMKSRSGGETDLLSSLGMEVMRFEKVLSPRFHPNTPVEAIRDEALRALTGLAPLLSGQFDLVVLDEFICLISAGIITNSEAIAFIGHKADNIELVLTGRGASAELIASADLVTEMLEIKHPFNGNIGARQGIEF